MNQFNYSTIKLLRISICSLLMLVVLLSGVVSGQSTDLLKIEINNRIRQTKSSDIYSGYQNYVNGKSVVVDSVNITPSGDTITLFFNKALAEMPIRIDDVELIKDSVRNYLPDSLKDVALNIKANNISIAELIPNYFREKQNQDETRFPQNSLRPKRENVVVLNRQYDIKAGLQSSNIALWNSHGWYYEPKLDRWEWQRARLFTSLEDISPTAFVIQYIAPMLENAGATVFIPRERDWQTNEVIVDNDDSSGKSRFIKPKKRVETKTGFAIGNQPYKNENPFKAGTSIIFESFKKKNIATYIPDIPEVGEYSVYVSYGEGDGEVIYRIYHSGGTTDFTVNQKMGFGTWIYLGKFHFNKGYNKKESKVELIVPENSEYKFSADAVRFGGGMGVVSRNGKTGGRARFFEAARYNLQFSGAPDTLVWNLSNGENDYTDDYKSRGEWVDWLIGAPFGPTKNRQYPGLKIPVDLAFAFHTDAGILPDDGIVGTLGIYSTDFETPFFPDGQSKYASRDLTDIIQTQIVDDINSIYKCNWSRRGMWNSQYSEAYRPNVPTMLLELLSHQNLNDVKYVLNPKFRFDVSRAIYKGMLRFLSTQNGYDYVVQPLPVDHLTSEFVGDDAMKLKWKPVLDELEPTAKPEKYLVYTREGDNGFNNGVLVDKLEITIPNLEKGKLYGFKVTAINAGGESFPSEIISTGIAGNSKGNVLIVNGFDRVGGPAVMEAESFSGIMRQLDHGVADGYDIATVGNQYDYNKKSAWLDDDSPGHGASYADLEITIFRGNTFDFSYVHGKSILSAGYSFVTSSDEAVETGMTDLSGYNLVDLIFGEEKTTYLPGNDTTPYFSIYTNEMLSAIEDYTTKGGNLFISGAYIGSDIPKDKNAVSRIGNIFKIKWRTNYAVKSGDFYSVTDDLSFNGSINTGYNTEQYPVEAPDGIEPFDETCKTIFRYTENNVSAGVIYSGKYKVIALGFPFESVKGKNERNKLMNTILSVLNQ